MSDFETIHGGNFDPTDERIGELFDILLIAQNHLEAYGDSDLTLKTYYEEIEELYKLLNEKTVAATGDYILSPAVDEDGNVSGALMGSGTALGLFDSIAVGTIPDALGGVKPTLGVRLFTGSNHGTSIIANKHIDYFLFAPIVGSTFNVEHYEEPELPLDPSDEVCWLIDEAMLGEKINLPNLVTIFEEVIEPAVDEDGDKAVGLQHEQYIKYLNKLASFQQVTAIADYGVQITEDGAIIYQGDDQTYTLHGQFEKFDLFCAQFDDTTTIKLMLKAIDEDGDSVGVIVDTIAAIELK